MSSDPIRSRTIEDVLRFPVLTREVGGPAQPSGGSPAALPGTAPLNQLIEGTLRGVLGWRPRTGDARGFLAALGQSFACQEVEGRMECRWTPRGSALVVQADLGAITGAQASLHTRAVHTLEKVLPLLDGLRPLRSEPDPEDVQSMRSIVRNELIELVAELGTVGGPRIQRVDQIFDLLLGGTAGGEDPESVAGQLAVLQERFGLQRSRVNTVEEEKVYSDFLTLVDYIRSLATSWEARRGFFQRGGTAEPFLGTQLVLLSRELAVAGESVAEAYFSLDSIFLGAAERSTLLLRFDGQEAPITLAELLDWVGSFVAREAPRLLEDAGKDGVVAFRSTLARLFGLVDRLVKKLPSRLDVPRVARALEELRDHLGEALLLAQGIEGEVPPELPDDPVSPQEGFLGQTLQVTITGIDAASVGDRNNLDFGSDIRVRDLLDVPGPIHQVRVRISIGAQAGTGWRPVVLAGRQVLGSFRVGRRRADRTLRIEEVAFPDLPLFKGQETTLTILGEGFIHEPDQQEPESRRIGIGIGIEGDPNDPAEVHNEGITLDPRTRTDGQRLLLIPIRVLRDISLVEATRLRIRIANPDGQKLVWTGGVTSEQGSAEAKPETEKPQRPQRRP